MIKAHTIEPYVEPHARPTVICPECKGTMSEGSKLCVQCEAIARGKRRADRWWAQKEPERQKRHRRVMTIMKEQGIDALAALWEAQKEWGEL